MTSGLAVFTLVHTIISLIGIASGFVVMYGLFASKRLNGWTMVFLVTTVATSVTGFGFPFHGLLPSHIVGIISLVVLAIAIWAKARHLAGAWRPTYEIAAMLALYLNTFVLVVQSFQKIPALAALAPTQTEPPFVATQVVVLLFFIVMTVLAVRKYHTV